MKLAECGCIIDADRNILATCQNHGCQLSLLGVQYPQQPITVAPLTVGPVICTCSVSGPSCQLHDSNTYQRNAK